MLLDEYMEKYEHKEKTRYGTADSRKEELEMAADALEDAAEVLKLVASGKVSQGKAAEMLCLGFKDFNDPNEYLGAFFSFVPKDIFYHALAVGRSPYENLIYDEV